MSNEKDVVASQALLQNIVNGVPIRVFWKDTESRFLGCNSLFAQDAGYSSPEALVGKTDFDVPWREQAEAYRADDRAVMQSGEPKLGYEEVQTTPDGRQISLRTSKVPLRDPSGKVIGILGIYEDISTTKAVAAELRQSEARLRALVDQSPLATQVVDRTGRTLSVNAAWEKLWGVPFAALANYSLLEDAQLAALGHLDDVRRAFAGEPVVMPAVEYDRAATPEVVGSSGKVWVRTILYPVLDAAGQVREVVLLHEDLTARRRAEGALRESERRFQALFERSPDPCWLIGPDDRFMLCNAAAAQQLGFEQGDQLLHRHPADHSPETQPDGRNSFEKATAMMALAHEHGVHRFEWVHRRRSGEEFPVEVTLAEIEMSGERLLYCVWRDISTRKRFETQLQSSRDFLEKLVRTASEGVAVGSDIPDFPFLRFSLWNDRMTGITGYTLEEINRLGWYQTLYPDADDRARAIARVERIRKGSELDREESAITTKSGERRVIEMSTSSLALEDGTPGVVGVVQDITDRRRMKEQLAVALRMESIGRLAGGVAHDFNNMLSVILNGTSLALEGLDPSHASHEDLSAVLEAAQRSAALTQQLLAFAAQQPAVPVLLDLNEKIAGMLKMVGRLIGENIRVIWAPAVDLRRARMDPSQLDQILANLCVNARDAITGVGTIRVATANVVIGDAERSRHPEAAAGPHVLLEFSDDGCGMSADVLSHVFEPFFTTKVVGRGTGLGLATLYGVVRQNGGHIDVESAPGKGTTFRIYLPASVDDRPSIRPSLDRGSPHAGTETILLVEDEPSVLNLTARLLRKLGYVVLAAESAAKALALSGAHQGRIDVLLSDVIMPEMSGLELSKELIAARPGLRVLFMSGFTADVIGSGGVLDPGVSFIGKPFTRDALAVKLREVLAETFVT